MLFITCSSVDSCCPQLLVGILNLEIPMNVNYYLCSKHPNCEIQPGRIWFYLTLPEKAYPSLVSSAIGSKSSPQMALDWDVHNLFLRVCVLFYCLELLQSKTGVLVIRFFNVKIFILYNFVLLSGGSMNETLSELIVSEDSKKLMFCTSLVLLFANPFLL